MARQEYRSGQFRTTEILGLFQHHGVKIYQYPDDLISLEERLMKDAHGKTLCEDILITIVPENPYQHGELVRYEAYETRMNGELRVRQEIADGHLLNMQITDSFRAIACNCQGKSDNGRV